MRGASVERDSGPEADAGVEGGRRIVGVQFGCGSMAVCVSEHPMLDFPQNRLSMRPLAISVLAGVLAAAAGCGSSAEVPDTGVTFGPDGLPIAVP
jgi:hypothetical protein